MADMLEDTTVTQVETPDPNKGKTMLDFVKSEVKLDPPTPEKSNESIAQNQGKTPEEIEKERLEKEEADRVEAEEAKKREEELANETPEEKAEREEKERLEEERQQKEDEEAERKAKEKEEKGPVPYERFEEVNNRYKVTVEEYERVKPLAEAHVQIQQYCEQYGITPDQFRTLLEVQRALNTNPEEGLKKLLPIVEQLQGFTGDKLPPDLQSKVDTGKMELSDAREFAKLRAQNTFGGQRFQQYQQIQAQRQQQEFQRAQVSAINSWVQGKAKVDPDFKPRADENAPRGRYEFVYDAVQSMLAERDANGQLRHVLKSPDDVPKLLEKAYQEVVKGLAPLNKKPATRKTLTQNGSTSHNTEVKIENARSMKEAIQIAAAAHGL